MVRYFKFILLLLVPYVPVDLSTQSSLDSFFVPLIVLVHIFFSVSSMTRFSNLFFNFILFLFKSIFQSPIRIWRLRVLSTIEIIFHLSRLWTLFMSTLPAIVTPFIPGVLYPTWLRFYFFSYSIISSDLYPSGISLYLLSLEIVYYCVPLFWMFYPVYQLFGCL